MICTGQNTRWRRAWGNRAPDNTGGNQAESCHCTGKGFGRRAADLRFGFIPNNSFQ
jgi:hypothetical protein